MLVESASTMDQDKHRWSCQRKSRPSGGTQFLRDHDGRWVRGVGRNLGICLLVHEEFWAAWMGLQIAWDGGCKKAILETYSLIVKMFLSNDPGSSTDKRVVMEKCKVVIRRDWEVMVIHIYREGNTVADGVANWVLEQRIGYHLLTVPPDSISALLLAVMQGITYPCWVA